MPDAPKPEGAPAPDSSAVTPPAPAAGGDAPAAAPPAAAPVEPSASAAPPAPKPAAPAAKPAAPAAAKPAPPKAPAVMVTTPWESDLTAALAASFGDSISAFLTYVGQNFIETGPATLLPLLERLRDEHDFTYLVDVTAVNWPQRPEPFDVVYVLYSFARNERIRVKLKVGPGVKPPSAVSVFVTADWLEREVYDMFGLEFADHPNMKRILLPDDWETFPLLKANSILKMDQRWVQENLGLESGQ